MLGDRSAQINAAILQEKKHYIQKSDFDYKNLFEGKIVNKKDLKKDKIYIFLKENLIIPDCFIFQFEEYIDAIDD